jgi:hypothetical protein
MSCSTVSSSAKRLARKQLCTEDLANSSRSENTALSFTHIASLICVSGRTLKGHNKTDSHWRLTIGSRVNCRGPPLWSVPGYTTEMYCVCCEVRTEFIYVM